MHKSVQEFTIIEEEDDSDCDEYERTTFHIGGRYYDEDEDLFTKKPSRLERLKGRKKDKSSSSTMLRSVRCCSALAAIFRTPSAAARSLYYVIIRNVVLILVYYILSIGLTFYQNHLLKEIHYPLSVVLCHLVVKFLLAYLIRFVYEVATGKKRVLLDWENWWKKLSLIGLSGGLDIGFSNWGQEFITVSLYTMSKSSAIIFILGFALVLKLEEQHWSLVLIVGMISGGLFMFTYKSTQFHPLGFSLIMAASFLSGLRWSMCQLVVQRTQLGLQNPIDMVFHVQPWMILAVLPFAAFFEGSLVTGLFSSSQDTSLKDLSGVDGDFSVIVYSVLFGALMAFFMEIAEYLVVTFTSSLTLSVAGIFKEICTLCLAVVFNGDQLTFINFLGLLLCFTGIICHVAFKFMKSATTSMSESESASGAGGGGGSIQDPARVGGDQESSSSSHHHHNNDLKTPLLQSEEKEGEDNNDF